MTDALISDRFDPVYRHPLVCQPKSPAPSRSLQRLACLGLNATLSVSLCIRLLPVCRVAIHGAARQARASCSPASWFAVSIQAATSAGLSVFFFAALGSFARCRAKGSVRVGTRVHSIRTIPARPCGHPSYLQAQCQRRLLGKKGHKTGDVAGNEEPTRARKKNGGTVDRFDAPPRGVSGTSGMSRGSTVASAASGSASGSAS